VRLELRSSQTILLVLVLLLVVVLPSFGAHGQGGLLGKPLPSVYACNVCSFLLTWGQLGSGNGQLNGPGSIALDSSGNVYVADSSNDRIEKFTASGNYVTQWGSPGTGNGQFADPSGVAVDSAGNVYVTDAQNYRVQKFNSTGAYITQWGSQGSGKGQFSGPRSIAVDSSGNVYVTDEGSNNNVEKFTSSGVFVTEWGSFGSGNGQFNGPRGIAVTSAAVYVTDYYNGRVQKFSHSGTYISQWGSSGSGQGQFLTPQDVAVDSSGNVYVADFGNNRVEKFDGSGNFILAWGCANASTQACPLGSANGQFNNPWGIAISRTGVACVTDQGNDRVQEFDDLNAANYPTIIGGQSCVVSSGYIYCVGGVSPSGTSTGYTNSVYFAKLSPSGVGSWTATTPYPTIIGQESCVASGGYIYCVGGISPSGTSSGYVNAVYFAKLSSSGVGGWTSTTPYPTIIAQQSCAVSVIAGVSYIYCVGGVSPFGTSSGYVNAVYFATLSPSGVGAWY